MLVGSRKATYQRKKWNDERLPDALYRRIIWLIRDYERMRRDELSGRTRPHREPLEAVEQAELTIPAEYRQHVMDFITHGKPFPDCANRKTWTKWKARLVRATAENLHEIDPESTT